LSRLRGDERCMGFQAFGLKAGTWITKYNHETRGFKGFF
jgi:hypothetical protein